MKNNRLKAILLFLVILTFCTLKPGLVKADELLSPPPISRDSSWIDSNAKLYAFDRSIGVYSISLKGNIIGTIGYHKNFGLLILQMSPNGKKLFYGLADNGHVEYWTFDLTSHEELGFSGNLPGYSMVLISPDWSKVAFVGGDRSGPKLYLATLLDNVVREFTPPAIKTAATAAPHPPADFSSIVWSNDQQLLLFSYGFDQKETYWGLNPQTGQMRPIGAEEIPKTRQVNYSYEGKLLGQYCDQCTLRNYNFSNGAEAFLDNQNNLKLREPSGDIVMVQPVVHEDTPHITPPPTSSGIACDCGIAGGVNFIPGIIGWFDNDYLVYTYGNNRIFVYGAKERRVTIIDLPRTTRLFTSF